MFQVKHLERRFMTEEEIKALQEELATAKQNVEILTASNAELTNKVTKLETVDNAVLTEAVETYKTQTATSAQLIQQLQKENARLVLNAEVPEMTDAELFKGIGRKEIK